MISSAGNRPFFTRVCFEKPAGKPHGIDAGGLPPGAFVACAMRGPVMHAAERDREFIARFAAQCAWLHVAQMVGIGWLAATDEARLLYDIAKVLAAAIAPRGGNGEDDLDAPDLCAGPNPPSSIAPERALQPDEGKSPGQSRGTGN